MLSETPLSHTASVSHARTPDETLLQSFDRHFVNLNANTRDLVARAQRVRYQVYCVENGFENPLDHPNGIESDAYDFRAVHSLLATRHSGQEIGTVRLILPRREAAEESFPIQGLTTHPIFRGKGGLPLHKMAEVSRFTISKEYRRGSAALPPGPLTSLGLIQALVRMSAENNIAYWCAMMEAKLLKMLAAMAIRFEPVGMPVAHHGLRQPCFCNVVDVLQRVKAERPSFWDVVTDGGMLWQPLLEAQQNAYLV